MCPDNACLSWDCLPPNWSMIACLPSDVCAMICSFRLKFTGMGAHRAIIEGPHSSSLIFVNQSISYVSAESYIPNVAHTCCWLGECTSIEDKTKLQQLVRSQYSYHTVNFMVPLLAVHRSSSDSHMLVEVAREAPQAYDQGEVNSLQRSGKRQEPARKALRDMKVTQWLRLSTLSIHSERRLHKLSFVKWVYHNTCMSMAKPTQEAEWLQMHLEIVQGKRGLVHDLSRWERLVAAPLLDRDCQLPIVSPI